MSYFTDQQIIELLLRREEVSTQAVAKQLYHQNQKEIGYFIITRGGNTQQADDIFQLVVILFLENVWRGKFVLKDAQIRTYLFGMASNLWQKEYRSRTAEMKRNGRYLMEQNRLGQDVPDPSTDIIEQQDQLRSLAIFNMLSKDDQEFLRAIWQERLSSEQMRVRFNLKTTDAVKARKYRIMEKIRAILEKLKQYEL